MLKYLLILLFSLISLNASKNNVYVQSKKNDINLNIYIVNKNLYDITILYEAKMKNLICSDRLPIQKVIKAGTRKLITGFYIKKRKYELRSTFRYTIGSKYSIHDDTYKYRLPYKLNTSKMVSQSFNGTFSHYGNSQYAVDFAMKIGTRIYAARSGVVVNIKNDGSKHGGKKYIREANFIIIRHSDGTYAKYAHLKKGAVKVKIGEKIKRGDFIGLSGNTGFTNGPHLHFIVFKGKTYNSRESIPIKFISSQGVIYKPIRGRRYKAVK